LFDFKKWLPTLAFFWGVTPKKVFMLFVKEFVGKNCSKAFRVSLRKFGQKSFAPPKLICSYTFGGMLSIEAFAIFYCDVNRRLFNCCTTSHTYCCGTHLLSSIIVAMTITIKIPIPTTVPPTMPPNSIVDAIPSDVTIALHTKAIASVGFIWIFASVWNAYPYWIMLI